MGIAKRNIGAVASKYNGERREFALGILLLCALAGTPLVWIKWLSFGGLSAGPFMLVLVVFSVFALLSGRRSTLRLYLSLNAGLIWSICLYVLYVTYVWGTLETFSLRDWLRPGLYAFFGFWVAVYVAGMSAVGPRTLALAAVAGAGGFLTAFGFAALNAGVDPIGTVLQSVRTGDTSLLMYTLFRSAMVAGAQESLEEVSANLRHGIGLGLVLCALTSLTFLSSVARRSLRLIIRSAVFLCLGFALLTLSRATLSVIALSLLQYAIAPLLFRHGAAKRRLGGIAVFFAFAGLFLIFNNLLVARIQETGSYSVRVEILSSSLKAIAENPIFPADRDSLGDAKGSSHVVAVDAWKYGGLLGGVLAIAFGFFLFVSNARLLFSEMRYSAQARGIGIDVVAGSCLLWLPLVRFFTAGSGLAGPEWLAIGLATGLLARVRALPKAAVVPRRAVAAPHESDH